MARCVGKDLPKTNRSRVLVSGIVSLNDAGATDWWMTRKRDKGQDH